MQRIADQLRRFYEGPSWLGPSLNSLLSEVDEASAKRRPIAGGHTIWEIVLHITAWVRIARERVSASEPRDPAPAEDWPPTSGSWKESLAELDAAIGDLEAAILKFPEERLDARAPAYEPQTFYELLHGVIQHSAYHAGQIALLKKS